MDRAFLATVVTAALLLVAGVGAGVFLTNAGVFEERRVGPDLTQFFTTGGHCVADPSANATVDARSVEGSTIITLRGNVTVPDASYTLDASFERTGPDNYTLSVRSVPTEKPTRECGGNAVAQARYTATVAVPQGERESFRVLVYHDNETVRVVEHGPDGLDSEMARWRPIGRYDEPTDRRSYGRPPGGRSTSALVIFNRAGFSRPPSVRSSSVGSPSVSHRRHSLLADRPTG